MAVAFYWRDPPVTAVTGLPVRRPQPGIVKASSSLIKWNAEEDPWGNERG